jgi:hypothetical protein
MNRRFVFDTNCIIDLEEDRPSAAAVRSLIAAWRIGEIDLAVVAVSASENHRDGSTGRNYSAFEAKLQVAGLSGVHVLLPPAIWDVSFWDHALWTDQEMEGLAVRAYSALFPNSSKAPPADAAKNSKWRNQLCDAIVVWSCIYHDWRHLVTRDENFHRRASALGELGLREILYPDVAAGLIGFS